MKEFTRRPLAAAIVMTSMASSAMMVPGTASAITATPSTNTFSGYTEVTTGNPFDTITSTGTRPSLVMMDLDADGDLDAVLFHDSQNDAFPYNGDSGYAYGATSIWENTGSKTAAAFTQVEDYNTGGVYGTGVNISINPFSSNYSAGYGSPVTAADIDGDDVLDFIAGQKQAGPTLQTVYGHVLTDGYGVVNGIDFYPLNTSGYGSNPFYGVTVAPTASKTAYGMSVAAADLDGDTDKDLVVMDVPYIRVYMNDGTVGGVFQFNELQGVNNPFYGVLLESENYGAPITLHDVDRDGDQDLVMGTTAAGALRLFINDGTASTAHFTEVTDTGEFDVSTKGWTSTDFADVNGDGRDDLIVMEQDASNGDAQSIRLFLADAAQTNSDSGGGGGGGGGVFGLLMSGLLSLLLRRRR